MEPEPSFPTDLYRGTAPYYDQYRPPYPEELFEDLCRRLPVSGGGLLLDLACGTGQVALPLAGRFAEVWAVDQEPESVAFGRAKAEAAGVANVRWVAGSAETVILGQGFELVTVGNAFHRLNRPVVAHRMFSLVQPGGAAALVWGDTPAQGDQAWQGAMAGLFEKWMAKVRTTERVPGGWEQAIARHPHEQVLAEAGFDYVGKFDFVAEQTWTVESLIGFAYSTSILNRNVLGAQAAAFERDVAGLLLSHQADGAFRVPASYAYQLAHKPQ